MSCACRYWLHVVDISVWVHKQSVQLHKHEASLASASAPAPALFSKQQVGSLHHMLLSSQLSYVSNPVNGHGMMAGRQQRQGKTKELDDLDGEELRWHVTTFLCVRLLTNMLSSCFLTLDAAVGSVCYQRMRWICIRSCLGCRRPPCVWTTTNTFPSTHP